MSNRPAKVHPDPRLISDVRQLKVSDSFKEGKWKPSVSMLADVARMTDPLETKERIKTSWSTMGIVSALILTMTYPSIITPTYGFPSPDNLDISSDPVIQTFVVLNIISFILALTIDILIVTLMTQLDLCCTPEHTRAFLIKFAPLNEFLSGMFGVSIIVLGAQVMAASWYNYSTSVNIAVMVIWAVFILLVAACAATVAMFNRAKVVECGTELMERLEKGELVLEQPRTAV